jgi:hypothetical protein
MFIKAINTHVMVIQRATMLFDAHDSSAIPSGTISERLDDCATMFGQQCQPITQLNVQTPTHTLAQVNTAHALAQTHTTHTATQTLTPTRHQYEDLIYKSFDLPTVNIISQMIHKLKQHISQYIIEKTLPTIELSDNVKQSASSIKILDSKPINMLYIPTTSTQIKNIYRFTNVKHCYILYNNSQRKLLSDILSTTNKKCNLNDLIAMYPRRIHNDNIPSRNFVDVSELSSITEKNVQNTNVMLNGRPVSATEMFNEKFMTSALNDSLQLYGVKYVFDNNERQKVSGNDDTDRHCVEDCCDDIINQLQLLPNYINKSIDVVYFESINETIRSVDEL